MTTSKVHPALKAVEKSGAQKVKVAVSDIDGILRGKYLHIDKFKGAAEPYPAGGFGFCDVVFGWDSSDQCYDNTSVTGWQHGFILYPGKLTEIETFRVGCIGAIGPIEMQQAVHAVALALEELGIASGAPA